MLCGMFKGCKCTAYALHVRIHTQMHMHTEAQVLKLRRKPGLNSDVRAAKSVWRLWLTAKACRTQKRKASRISWMRCSKDENS